MQIHHLNCGGRSIGPLHLIVHILAIEHDGVITLVDSGFWSGSAFGPLKDSKILNNKLVKHLTIDNSAASQLRNMSLPESSVRHIVLTHMDLDHAAGVPDFPDATVHVTDTEWNAFRSRRMLREFVRYWPWHMPSTTIVKTYKGDGPEKVLGLNAHRVSGVGIEMYLIPYPGHTRGHAIVAIRTDKGRWLVHAGDSFYQRRVVDKTVPTSLMYLYFAVAEVIAGWRPFTIRRNHRRIRELFARPDVDMICAHDADLFFRNAPTHQGGAAHVSQLKA